MSGSEFGIRVGSITYYRNGYVDHRNEESVVLKKSSEEPKSAAKLKPKAVTAGSVFSAAAATIFGCAPWEKGERQDGGSTNITPKVDGEDGGVIIMEDEYLINGLGPKIQGSGQISVGPVAFSYGGAAGKTVKVIFESVPEHVFNKYGAPGLPEVSEEVKQELFKLDGIINMTEVAYHPQEAQINIGTADDPYWIRDPRVKENRISTYMGEAGFTDLTGRTEDYVTEYCNADDLSIDACNAPIGAAGAEKPAPFEFIVKEEASENNEGKFEIDFSLIYNTQNYTEGHNKHAYAVRIWRVIE